MALAGIAHALVTVTVLQTALETPAALCKTYRVEQVQPLGAEVQEAMQKAARGEARDRGFLLHSRIPCVLKANRHSR